MRHSAVAKDEEECAIFCGRILIRTNELDLKESKTFETSTTRTKLYRRWQQHCVWFIATVGSEKNSSLLNIEKKIES